jgi:hypothetical protein
MEHECIDPRGPASTQAAVESPEWMAALPTGNAADGAPCIRGHHAGIVDETPPPADESYPRLDAALSCASLRAQPSRIAGAGLGLFAAVAIRSGATVCDYTGPRFRTAQAIRVRDKSYLMRLGPQAYVDARPALGCPGRYINDGGCAASRNVAFDKRPEAWHARVVATRDIAAGEELLTDYGGWYWAGSKTLQGRAAGGAAGTVTPSVQ